MQLHLKDIQDYWEKTRADRDEVRSILNKFGVEGLDLASLCTDMDRVARPSIWSMDTQEAIDLLAKRMLNPGSAEFNGFYLLDIGKALDNEAVLVRALKEAVGDVAFRQMAAFKANHSLPLQYARLKLDPDAGLEVASAAEVVAARSIGFKPDNIIFANPSVNERELLVSWVLGVSAFCFDHPERLRFALHTLDKHGFDKGRLRTFVRLATSFASASVSMDRFGIDVFKSKAALRELLRLLASAGAKLAGVSFHVGMSAKNYVAYEHAFDSVAQLYHTSREILGEIPRIVDIGGGFDSSDIGHTYYATLSLKEQIACIGRGVKKLQQGFDGHPLELWSEIGQGYVGNAGSLFVRVDSHELRENPSHTLEVCAPALPGSVLWSSARKKIFAEHEQRLLAHAGHWTLGVTRYVTLYLEVWALSEDGQISRLPFEDARLVPTVVFGKTCDPRDTLNQQHEGGVSYMLLPRLADHAGKTFLLRLASAAYTDTGGDFNWQSTRLFPTHCVVSSSPPNSAYYPRRALVAHSTREAQEFEFRDRLLARNLLTSSQLHQARCLVAEQFMSRETMMAWLKGRGLLGTSAELEPLRYVFWELVDACIDSGFSIARLQVPRGAPDADGQVVAVITAKVLREKDRPVLPLSVAFDRERRRLRAIVETEAILFRRIFRINDTLREKLLPMAYLAMLAIKPGVGRHGPELYAKAVDLARGAAEIKSVGSMPTGQRSTELVAQIADAQRVLCVPYEDIVVHGERVFSGIMFGEQKGVLSFFVHDLRGPHRFAEPLPQDLTVKIRISDAGHIPHHG